jgi:glycosyltransferase involved in cell wall biosynthesis
MEQHSMNALVQRICLNMIVKNEAPVIQRCLASVMPLIDMWVIVDTGSTDGTQQLIRETLAHLPGELHERPWVDFAHNRSEALELARGFGEYIFVIDADEILEMTPGFVRSRFEADSYNLQVRYSGISYNRRQLVSNALPWRYEGVLHEYMTCPSARTEEFLDGLVTVPHHDGARARDPLTYKRDVAVLEIALEQNPGDMRYTFYLAQSYRDAGDFEAAIRSYERRVELGGWVEEVWYSLYQIAQLKERLQYAWPDVMESYLTAWEAQPERAGPLYRIAIHYQAMGKYATSYVFLNRAAQLKKPGPRALFVENALYDYQIALDHAVAAYYVGEQETAIAGNNGLLRADTLPAFALDQVVRNRRFSLDLHYNRLRKETDTPLAISVVIPIDRAEPGSGFDDCLDSLLHQEGVSFKVIACARATNEDADRRLAERVHLAAHFELKTTTDGDTRSLVRGVTTSLPTSDVVVLLSPQFRLASSTSLATLAGVLHDETCYVAFGQYKEDSGKLGTAEPPASARLLDALSYDIAEGSPLVVRAALLQRVGTQASVDRVHLIREAGYDHLQFLDDVCSVDCRKSYARVLQSTALPQKRTTAGVKLPKISCMMVTLDRLQLAKHSILLFAQQSYPERELVIVTDGTAPFRAALERYVAALGLDNVQFVYPEGPRRTLGQLRNLAIEAATGEILCQWDDDDSNHPDRLMVQAQHMLQNNAGACFLSDHLQLIEEKRTLCWINWAAGASEIGPDNLAPGTLMMHRNDRIRYPEEGPLSRQGEDSVVLSALNQTVPVKPLQGQGHLYLYRFHGRNTFSREHHYNLSNFRYSNQDLVQNYAKLREAARLYRLPEPCYVLGEQGPAFVLDAKA